MHISSMFPAGTCAVISSIFDEKYLGKSTNHEVLDLVNFSIPLSHSVSLLYSHTVTPSVPFSLTNSLMMENRMTGGTELHGL